MRAVSSPSAPRQTMIGVNGLVLTTKVTAFCILALVIGLSGGIFSLRLSGIDPRAIARTGTTSDRSQIIFGVCYGLLILWGLMDQKRYFTLLRRNWIYLLLPAFAILSTTWAPVSFISLRKAAAFTGGILAAHAVAARLGGRGSFIFLTRFFTFLVVLSVLYVLVDHSYAIHQSSDGFDAKTHAGQWRGVFIHRTVLGRVSALSIGLLLACGRQALGNRWLVWGGIAISALTLVMAWSGGAFASVALLIFTPYVIGVYRRATPLARPRVILVYTLIAVAVLVFAPLVLSGALTILGKDQTLTGRIPLWRPMLISAQEHPFLGFGYSTGFSLTVAIELNALTGFGLIPNAQNGYLDTVLNLGLIGLSIVGFAMVRAARTALAVAVKPRLTTSDAWQIVPILMIVFYVEANTVEAWMVEPNNIMVIVFALTIAAIRAMDFEGAAGEKFRLSRMTDGDRRAARRASAEARSPHRPAEEGDVE